MRRCGWYVGLSLLLGVASACSAIVEFDPDRQPCTSNGACLDGYSCMVDRCIADRSLTDGQTCFRNRMCEESLRCSIPEFVCRRPCLSAFGDSNECGRGSACVASRDSDERFIAVCRPSECSAEIPCPQPGDLSPVICAQITSTAGICLDSCSVTCAVGQACGDDCRVDRVCHPVGLGHILTCLEPGVVSAQGAACDVSTDRCEAGLACSPSGPQVSTGTCLRFCDEAADCGALPCNLASSNDHSLCGSPL